MPRISLQLVIGLFGLGLLAPGAVVAELTVELPRSELFIPPGGAALVEGTLFNTGTTPIFLNGISSTVDSDWSAEDEFDFVPYLPARLDPGEAWEGPFLQLRASGTPATHRETFGVTFVGGDLSRSSEPLATAFFVVDDSTLVSDTGDDPNIPPVMLLTARPNPFQSTTTLHFELEIDSRVEVAAFNVHGQRVRNLGERLLGRGAHAIEWDGRDEDAKPVQSGIYFLRVAAGDRRLKTTVVRIR